MIEETQPSTIGPIPDADETAVCKAEGCHRFPGKDREFCDRCWKHVPFIVRQLMLDHYRPGQGQKDEKGHIEIVPSLDYTVAVRTAIACIIFQKQHHRKPPKSAILKVQLEIARQVSETAILAIAERKEREKERAAAAAATPSDSPEKTTTPEKETT